MKQPAQSFLKSHFDRIIPDGFYVKNKIISQWSRFKPISIKQRGSLALQELDELSSLCNRKVVSSEVSLLHLDFIRTLLKSYRVSSDSAIDNMNAKALELKFYREFSSKYKLQWLSEQIDRSDEKGWTIRKNELSLIFDDIISAMQEDQLSLSLSKNRGIDYYRYLASFKITPFNLPLIKGYARLQKLGWYNRETNPIGLVKDHRLSIHDGFSLNIPPSIIGHPANCEFLSFLENGGKSKDSSISYDQLILDIKKFNIAIPSK